MKSAANRPGMNLLYYVPAVVFCFWCALTMASSALAVDLAFVDAYHKKDVRVLQKYLDIYAGTPVEPYVLAAMVDAKDAQEGMLSPSVASVFEKYAGVPPIEKLRAALLKSWARRGDWEQFSRHVNRVPDWLAEKDPELGCATINFRMLRGVPLNGMRTSLFQELGEFPVACPSAFAGSVASGEIAPASVRAKILQIAAFKGESDARRLLDTVTPELEKSKVNTAGWSGAVALVSAARDDYQNALRLYEKSSASFDAETGRDILVHIGALAAKKTSFAAHDIIKRADGYRRAVSQPAAEWRTRAAILAGAWGDVITSIATMPESVRSEPVWQYWHARALQKRGKMLDASQLYADLSRQPGYYGLLAAERIGQRPPYLTLTYQPDRDLIAQFEHNPVALRVVALHKAGLWVEAAFEWNLLLKGRDSATHYAAAHFAKAKCLIDRQIGAAQYAPEHIDLELRFPLAFQKEVLSSARDTGLPPELLWAVMRQESRFVPHAVSSSGAVGLMQLMPATARLVAAKAGLVEKPTRSALIYPELNIPLGAAYLNTLQMKYERNYAFIAAAYNAGPGRVDRWRVQLAGTDLEQFIELIPYTETRDYAKQVLSNFVLYSFVRNQTPISLATLLAKKT
ncbi:MAG TPA: transglycosylase SLT domain-containing protein [Dissulfurispiraceae bacterium]|nr:transglycosylase SLT domain-containing protein [Dissulfurispiraceae bacterium]